MSDDGVAVRVSVPGSAGIAEALCPHARVLHPALARSAARPRVSARRSPGPRGPGRPLIDHVARVLPRPADRDDAGLNPELVALIEALVRGDRRRAARLMTPLETHLAGIGLLPEARRA